MAKLISFRYEGVDMPVTHLKSQRITEGVECDVYAFDDDPTKDLAIVNIKQGHQTPRQRVLAGDSTKEGHISGYGSISITRVDGTSEIHSYPAEESEVVDIGVGDEMQWSAETDLTIFEVCLPPFKDGRFKDLQ